MRARVHRRRHRRRGDCMYNNKKKERNFTLHGVFALIGKGMRLYI